MKQMGRPPKNQNEVSSDIKIETPSYQEPRPRPSRMMMNTTDLRDRVYALEDYAVQTQTTIDLLLQEIRTNRNTITQLTEQLKGVVSNG